MKKLLLLIGFVSLTINAQAPAIQWQKTLGGTANEFTNSVYVINMVQQTTDGGYIIAGQTNSNDGNVIGNHGNNDAWVVKLSSTGNIEWQKTLGGTNDDYAYGIKQTADGGYIVACSTNSNDGDVTGNLGGSDAWAVKLSSSGSIEWQKTLGGFFNDYAHNIQQTSDGGYIMVGRTNRFDGLGFNQDAWVVKLSSTGNIEWQIPFNDDLQNSIYSIQQTTDGGYILAHNNVGGSIPYILKLSSLGSIEWQKTLLGTGNCDVTNIKQTTDGGYIVTSNTNSSDGDVTGNHGGYDAWVVKLSSTGSIQWQKTLGGTLDDSAYNIQQTADGGYIVGGTTNSNDGDVTGYHGNGDIWVVKLSSSGVIQWQKTLGGTLDDSCFYNNGIIQITDGSYIILGQTSSNDGDVTGYNGGSDFWVVKLSSSGNILWKKTLGGTLQDEPCQIQLTTDGGYILGGYTLSSDGDVTGYHGNVDIWVVKLSPDLLNTTDYSNNSINLYPNPTRSLINIQSSNNVVLNKISITDLTGKIVMEQTQNTNQINVEKLASGVYILNAYSEGGKYQEKFIKE